ncbi:MAG: NAD(P)H-hydrate epimerase, partial [Acidobacteriota bacterium]
MKVLTPAAMAAVDRRAIETFGIPGMVLMENAARGLHDALTKRFPDARRVAILCGPGNNGGDGLALARLLAAAPDAPTPDAFLFVRARDGETPGPAPA